MTLLPQTPPAHTSPAPAGTGVPAQRTDAPEGRRILLVDDEQRILDALRRTLRGRYDLTMATSGDDGLDAVRAAAAEGRPFAVVVSDMMMPGMNGAEFLAAVRTLDADMVMLILSGQADLTSTISAVNNANLFRFLTKPCEPADLTRALDDALRQHQLVQAERELLERTLGGAVDVLTEVLSLATPSAAARTDRMRTLTAGTAAALGLEDDWRLPIAAMLSQVGCVAVPPAVLDDVVVGRTLSEDDALMYRAHPALAERLLARIPRLGTVATWVGAQLVELPDPAGPEAPVPPPADREGTAAAAFAAVSGFLAGYEAGLAPRDVVRALGRTGRFPQAVLDAVLVASDGLEPKGRLVQVRAANVRAGMVLACDVVTTTGLVLVRKGEKVTEVLATRIENFERSVGIVEPLEVLVVDG
ncbi:MAG: response regulator [Actinobacteria bacterium]|nr:response regulator [Actinomycetota bacterium]